VSILRQQVPRSYPPVQQQQQLLVRKQAQPRVILVRPSARQQKLGLELELELELQASQGLLGLLYGTFASEKGVENIRRANIGGKSILQREVFRGPRRTKAPIRQSWTDLCQCILPKNNSLFPSFARRRAHRLESN
jgi:hypothetical protein